MTWKDVESLFRHCKTYHYERQYYCGLNLCSFESSDFSSFRNHINRIHNASSFASNDIHRIMTSRDSFFSQFFQSECDFDPPDVDISFNPNEQHQTESESYNEFQFTKKFGKLAFKHCLANYPSRTSNVEYIPLLLKLFVTEKPSQGAIEYAADVFGNPTRVIDYLEKNFCKFNFANFELKPGCSIFKTDLADVFQHFLSIPFIVDHLFFSTERKDYLDNIFDGSFSSPRPNTIYVSLYYDDFNPLLNSLSSNSKNYKCSSIYIKVLNVSPLLASKRSCVLPFSIFHSKHFAADKDIIFDHLTDDINQFFESGVTVNSTHYDFVLVGISCDNLGAHELLGMSNFNASHVCRFCLMSKTENQEIFVEDNKLIRNMDSMSQDLDTFKKISTVVAHVNGICGANLFSKLSNFDAEPIHFFSCMSHDLFEKVVPEVITTTIRRMHKERLIDETSIYSALNNFEYSYADRQNPVNFESSLASLSASQGRMFGKLFLFVLRNLLPQNHPLFQGLILIVDIVDMVYAPFFYKSWFSELEANIEKLLRFERCTLNLTIYPKLHYLMHYPALIKKFGPMRYLSTDQFESAHRHFKSQLVNSSNHKEIIHTMFKGATYKYSYMYSEDYIADSCVKFKSELKHPSSTLNTLP